MARLPQGIGSFNSPTNMLSSFSCFLIRAASTAVALVSLDLAAVAQPANPNADSFQLMHNDQGEQMRPAFSNGDDYGQTFPNSIDFNFWGYPLYFSHTRGIPIPPLPPALDEDMPFGGFAGTVRLPAASCSREIFYGPYAAWPVSNQWSPKGTEQIAAYQNARANLLREIQVKLDQLRDAPPAARRAALAELATQQEARSQAVEADAEAIRLDLKSADVKYYLIGPPPFGNARDDRANEQSLRLFRAIFFLDGLSVEQRQLIAEIAYSPDVAAQNEKSASGEGHGDVIFFLPATARIRLPANLPPTLQTKVQAFTAEKESLKTELRQAALQENDFSVSRRTQRLAALAAAQAPRFAALDALAEEIRVEFADSGEFDQSGQSGLPADLTQKVGDYYSRKIKVRREVLARLRQLRVEFPAAQFDVTRQGEGLTIVGNAPSAESVAGLAAFNARLSSRYAAFASEHEVLRKELQRYADANPAKVARTVNQLAIDFAKAYAEQEKANRYRNYFRAVLEPGLSAVQRRLLFQSAAEELDQMPP